MKYKAKLEFGLLESERKVDRFSRFETSWSFGLWPISNLPVS